MDFKAAVITVSDKGYTGERADTSGPAICAILRDAGFTVSRTAIVPDDMDMIKSELIKCSDELKLDLVLTTGGTGFSPRDITPEATLAVIERETRGIPEAMRAESLRITPRGCLSRSAAGIRGATLIVNLPGSEKAAKENLNAVLSALGHGIEMLRSSGSANCAEKPEKEKAPSLDKWLKDAKSDMAAKNVGMYLIHNGVVRATAKAQVRGGDNNALPVCGMELDCDADELSKAVSECENSAGISFVRVWVNSGRLKVGDDIMCAVVGGDIRPNVQSALSSLVDRLKNDCLIEKELCDY